MDSGAGHLLPRRLLLQLGLDVPDVVATAVVVVPLEEGIDGAHGAVLQVIADMPVDADALVTTHGIADARLVVLLQQMQQAVLGGVGRLLQIHGLVGVRQSHGHIPTHLVYPELGPTTAGRFVAGAGGDWVAGAGEDLVAGAGGTAGGAGKHLRGAGGAGSLYMLAGDALGIGTAHRLHRG